MIRNSVLSFTTLRRAVALASLLLLGAVAGCGGGNASVSGTVKYKGAAVTGGTLTFSPKGKGNPGKPAIGTIGKDGAFTLTSGKNSGAPVGPMTVTYTAPDPEVTEEQRKDPKFEGRPSPYAGKVPKQSEVEIKPGTNTLEIELIDPPPTKK